ncbi:hypothetical protein, partial [Thiolapillus sp.]|uniref:hypothetical protein n=1 Tax=Thiolapillus sp. TaxID=2017437 RepID=UPI003AF9A3A5
MGDHLFKDDVDPGAPLNPLTGRLAQVFATGFALADQACLRPRDRFWDIPVPKIDSAFDNLFVPQPSWSPSTTQQLRKLVAAPYLAPNDWTPRSEAYFVFPLAQGTPGKQCGLAATGVYQPSLRSPWLAARGCMNGLNRAGVVATDSIVLVPLAVGAWVGDGGIVLGGLR